MTSTVTGKCLSITIWMADITCHICIRDLVRFWITNSTRLRMKTGIACSPVRCELGGGCRHRNDAAGRPGLVFLAASKFHVQLLPRLSGYESGDPDGCGSLPGDFRFLLQRRERGGARL